jgi:hypothetical protein
MAEQRPCDICGNQAEYSMTRDSSQSWHRVVRRCPRCGEFEFDGSAGLPKNPSIDEMVRLSGWVREQNAFGVVPVPITRETWHRVTHMQPPGRRERANRALGMIARKHPDVRWIINVTEVANELELQGVTYSRTSDEATQLLYILLDDEYLKWAPGGSPLSGRTDGLLTPKGLLAAEALGASGSNSAQGFVARWFDNSLQDAWTNGFHPGIRAAGFRPVRIDKEDYIGGVSDEIMAQIRRSRFVVADYTGRRNGVYFEAGFASGLGLSVIPTCRADEIDTLHFDIKHLNTLLWNTSTELAEGLNRRIRAVVGIGPDADPS